MNSFFSLLKSTLFRKLAFLCFIMVTTSHASYAILRHAPKTERHPTLRSGKVLLVPQPRNPLTAIAFHLNKTDIDFALQHGEKPLILIGTATLSTIQKTQKTLFVQLQSASLCGSSGCTTTAYLKKNNRWVKILDSVSGDITILKNTHKRMHDLQINNAEIWIWNGKTYTEPQPGPNMNGLRKSIENYQKNKNISK